MSELPKRTAVGILAGGGALPGKVAEAVSATGRPVFIIAFQDFAEANIVEPWPHEYVRLAAAGRILSLLRQNNCRDIVLIGPVKRPSWRDLRPDAEGAKILAKIGKALFAGDDGLLAALVKVLGDEGFNVLGAHEFLDPVTEGVLGKIKPDPQALEDIIKGIEINRALGALDIGQACIIQNGVVIAVEAMEGTDLMLLRAKDCQQPGPGGVLVKQVKPGQERRADMPTIGPQTIRKAFDSGLKGIAFEAGGTLLVNQEEVIRLANEKGLFLLSYNPDNFEIKYIKK
ncbi:LpxI family protein [Commensalibacter oyaizuii]|uniref:UDP-2,3-diacylglucosamine diphosphatase LpxI n=1 Tax=Commensalibacter oyaizuii TaxID=3043873 RepID=A0ABT6PYZ3_9PROT|nr:UDP-2,3-diacylglucosamine diphosphatase LpxI [Commensalibacter sp. TBRC 16381]MDI2090077.1 UDP-2,3-diacylglucosamine diphosphatase LpxI [Commensalibacter sp. TBRC 16381]